VVVALGLWACGGTPDALKDKPDAGSPCEGKQDGEECGPQRHCIRQRCRTNSCGDGIVADDEACDDGNRAAADGCDSDCQIEREAGCGAAGASCQDATARDAGSADASDGNCQGLRHAYRRDDLSGTTDTFLSLIGVTGVGTLAAPAKTFCNGIENEDLDPIRRDCGQGNSSGLDPDSVCSTIPMRNRNLPFDAASGNPSGAGTANVSLAVTSATQLFQPKTACAAVADCTAAGAPTSATCVSGFCQVPSVSDLGLVLAVSPIPAQVNDALRSTADNPVVLTVCAANSGTASKVGAYCTSDANCSVSPDAVVAGSCAPDNPQYDQTACTAAAIGSGRVSLAQMPFAAITNSQRCPSGAPRSGNKCPWPTRAANLTNGTGNWWNCKTKRTNRLTGAAAPWQNYDARAYNWVPRHPQTGELLLPDTTAGTGGVKDARFTGGGTARIHMQLPKTALAGHPACTRSDATDQIGCLVEADPCSIGYGGLQASDADNTVAGMNAALLLGKVDGSGEVVSSTDRIQDLVDSCGAGLEGRYPLARILWLNASKGYNASGGGVGSTIPTFSSILNTVDSDPGDDVLGVETAPNDTDTVNEPDGVPDLLTREQDLTACYAAAGTPATAAAPGSLVLKHHFIPLPAGSARLANCVSTGFSFVPGSTW
jgi:cysteine-rich repeat protein